MIDFMQTPARLTGYVLEREGCPLHYWLGGPVEAPLLALMHGATMDHRMFNAQVEALADDYRVLVWDARGHGRSRPMGVPFSLELAAADILAILDHHGIEQAVFGGQSLGGYVAQHVAFRAPQRVMALVVIGSTPLTKAYGRFDRWALKATLPLFSLWPINHFRRVVANNTAVHPAVQAYAQAAISQIPRDDFLAIWRAVMLAIDGQGKPGYTFDMPLLLLHGDQDGVGTIKRDMPAWAQLEPMAQYHVIPDAGHNANQDNTAVANTLLRNFLDAVTG